MTLSERRRAARHDRDSLLLVPPGAEDVPSDRHGKRRPLSPFLQQNGHDDFGMFRWMVVPLLNALKWVHGYLGNYGWSIIALTVLINLAIFPLRHKSVVSMRRMQAIQPEVKAIQDRYAKLKLSDPARQKMNVELMSGVRSTGVP